LKDVKNAKNAYISLIGHKLETSNFDEIEFTPDEFQIALNYYTELNKMTIFKSINKNNAPD